MSTYLKGQSLAEIKTSPTKPPGELIVPGPKPMPTPEPPEESSRDPANTGILVLTSVMGAAFAFAVGLKVHSVIASTLAIAVLGTVIFQGTRR